MRIIFIVLIFCYISLANTENYATYAQRKGYKSVNEYASNSSNEDFEEQFNRFKVSAKSK